MEAGTTPSEVPLQDQRAWWGRVLPNTWRAVPIKAVVSLQSGEQLPTDRISEVGMYPVYGGNGLRGYTDRYTHDGDFVLIGRQGALCGNVNYASGKFWASEHAIVASPRVACPSKWLGEALRVMNLGQYSMTAAQPGLAVDMIRNLWIPLPEPDERAAISKFLDREIAEADTLVSKYVRLGRLLEDKRVALVTQATTKGFNPNVSMKKSDVEWIGHIPLQWNVLRLGNMTESIQTGPFGSMLHREDYVEGGVPIINPSHLLAGTIVPDRTISVTEGIATRLNSYMLKEGDIVLARRGEMGRAALVTAAEDGWILGTGSMRIRPSTWRCDARYLVMSLASDRARKWFSLQSLGSTMDNLSPALITHFPVVVPPLQEQQRIVKRVDAADEEIETMIGKVRLARRLVLERRSALITAAVTGQIDVNNYHANRRPVEVLA